MSSTRNPGRVAGFLYLVLVVFAPFRLIYIPSHLFVHGNATATANNIAAHELLFRLGIVSDLFCGTILIFLVLALYRLLKGVDHSLAVLMVILGGVMPAIIDFLNVLNDAAALMLVRGADFLSAFEKPQRDALAMLFLRLHHQEILAAEILWGLWLFPLAVLVYRSRFLPRFLGVWLIIDGFAYLTISFTGLLLPQYEDMVSNITFPALLGEMAIMLWLLIKGGAASRDRWTPQPHCRRLVRSHAFDWASGSCHDRCPITGSDYRIIAITLIDPVVGVNTRFRQLLPRSPSLRAIAVDTIGTTTQPGPNENLLIVL